jgi:hypothetical protein
MATKPAALGHLRQTVAKFFCWDAWSRFAGDDSCRLGQTCGEFIEGCLIVLGVPEVRIVNGGRGMTIRLAVFIWV